MSDENKCIDCVTEGADHNTHTNATDVTTPGPSQASSSAVGLVKHNALDRTTFIAPSHPVPYSVTIEFCNRCRWIHRASWYVAFPKGKKIYIQLKPSLGRVSSWCSLSHHPLSTPYHWFHWTPKRLVVASEYGYIYQSLPKSTRALESFRNWYMIARLREGFPSWKFW